MTILLCNDDGVESGGLLSLREGLIAAGFRVISVAPAEPRSGTSRAATFRKPVTYWQVGGDEDNPVYACDGTPVDCVRVSLLSTLGSDVELVISGINEGANLGDDATYSSTVGAAIEGSLLGLPAFAVSQQSRDGLFRLVDNDGYDWESSVAASCRLASAIIANPLPERVILNLNLPGKPAPGSTIEITRLGHRAWVRHELRVESNEHGEGYFSFGVNAPGDAPYHLDDGTDFAALQRGNGSLTPISVHWAEEQSAATRAWLERFEVELTKARA